MALPRHSGPMRRDSTSGRPVLPIAIAMAVMVVWGGTPIFTKLATAQIDPLLVGVLRTVLAGAVALPLALVMRLALPTDTRGRQLLAFSGFAAFVAFPLLFSVGQAQTSALHGALVLATLPVFTSLFGTLIERRRVSKTWIAGCAVALAGEAVLIVWRAAGESGGSTLAGDGIVLASSVICALGYVAGARLQQRGYGSLPTTLWGAAGAAMVLLPLLGWLLAQAGVPQAGTAAWGSVVVLAVVTSVLGYVAWYWALGHGGISRVASVQFTQPLFGIALAALVLGERPAPMTALAAIGILAGAALVLRAGSR
jgi:drug/metabolite transporter (DMT)-like permease